MDTNKARRKDYEEIAHNEKKLSTGKYMQVLIASCQNIFLKKKQNRLVEISMRTSLALMIVILV